MKFKVVTSLILFSFLLFPQLSSGAEVKSTFPRLANYFLKWEISETEARELAKWDLLILDMETQENSPQSLRLIRELNPSVVILAYITAQEIISDIDKTAGNTNAFLRRELSSAISDNWWLRDASGQKIENWPGTHMINLSNVSPTNYDGQRFNDYLPEFIANKIYSSGYFDGVFYDNTWGDVSWVNGNNIDIDGDGKNEDNALVDNLWATGYKQMLQKTRDLTGENFVIVGNGRVHFDYQNLLNGMMLESFPSSWENGGTWEGSLETYLDLAKINLNPQFNIINVNKKNQTDYKSMRFGLVSTLLGDGFYSYDYDVSNHSQTWWYDEYSANLGPAKSEAYNILTPNNNVLQPGLWRRDFKFGLAFLNSTNKDQLHIFSKENVEKINGTQDKIINNGNKINYLKLAPQDGVLLLKSSDNIYNSTFINGYFYRVFNNRGDQVKNGFFSFSPAYPASSAVVVADGSRGDSEDVSLVASNGRIVLKKNGSEIAPFYAYNNLFRKSLNIDTDIHDGFIKTVAVGPIRGGGPQVRVFTATGNLISSFFAYDKNLRGGVSVALGDLNGDGELDLVTGAGYGDAPVVKVFTLSGKIKYSFLVYAENFRGGVEVAVGDLSGNGLDEIVVGPGPGGGPHIRIFSGKGRLLGQFFAYDNNMRSGLKITLSDINQDGKKEILVGVKNIF